MSRDFSVNPLRRMLGDVRAEYRSTRRLGELLANLADLPAWVRAGRSGSSPLGDRRPWISYPAIRRLAQITRREMNVFEWGVGGSTAFFLDRGVRLVSVEHDRDWADRVRTLLGPHSDWTLLCIPGAADRFSDTGFDCEAEIRDFRSRSPGHAATSYQRYVEAISGYPDMSFDLVMVDGRARPACLLAAAPKLRAGGYLILDNADRRHYATAMERLGPGFHRSDYRGLCGHANILTTTTLWYKPSGG